MYGGILAIYSYIAHPWVSGTIFYLIIALVTLVMVGRILSGEGFKYDLFSRKAQIALAVISIIIVPGMWLVPSVVLAKTTGKASDKFTESILYTFGLRAERISYALCKDEFGRADLCDRITGRRIDIVSSTTNKPLVWYSKDENEIFTLFTNEGFDPITAEPLKSFTAKERKLLIQQLVIKESEKKEAEDKAKADIAASQETPSEPQAPPETVADNSGSKTEPQNSEQKLEKSEEYTTVPGIVAPLYQIPVAMPDAPREIIIGIAIGTKFQIITTEDITNHAKEDSVFLGRLSHPIIAGSIPAFDQNASVIIKVISVKNKNNPNNGYLEIRMSQISRRDHGYMDIETDPIIFEVKGKSILRRIGETAIGTAIGAAGGYAAAGKKGAIVGASGGTAAGYAISAKTDGKTIVLPAGSVLEFKTTKTIQYAY